MPLPKYFLSVFLLVFITACNTNHEKSSRADVLAADIDSSLKPTDDFFTYANGKWFKQNPIPADESAWGLFEVIPDTNLRRLRLINTEAATEKHDEGSAEQKIGDFWKAANDSAAIEKKGIAPLQPYLQKIDSVHDAASLQNTMAALAAMGVDGAIQMYVEQDEKNSTLEILQAEQTGLGLPEREFYLKTDSTSVAIRNKYNEVNTKILTLLGEDSVKAAASAKNILALETQLAKASKKLEDLRDPYANYHKYAFNDLNKVSPLVNWKNYINILGIPQVDSVIVGQPEYYSAAGKLMQSNFDTWKDYLKINLVKAYSSALPDVFGRTGFELGKMLSGAT